MTFKNDVSTSAANRVYITLLAHIMNFALKPGDLLSEKAIADSLQISRSPVREALAKLAIVGLVDIYAQRGTIVAPLRISALLRSQFLRESVEIGIARRAALLKERSDLTTYLFNEVALQETLASISDHKRFSKSDEEFHQYISSAVSLLEIWADISNAKLHMDRWRALTPPNMRNLTTIVSQHRAIAEAIAKGDEDAAALAMQQHLRKIFPLVPELIARFPEYFEPKDGGTGPGVRRPDLRVLFEI